MFCVCGESNQGQTVAVTDVVDTHPTLMHSDYFIGETKLAS